MGDATESGRSRDEGPVRRVGELLARRRELGRYETLVQTVTDGVYVLDRDLRFSFVNERLCEMTGRPRAELLGTPVTALFADDDEADAADEIRRRVVAGETDVGTVQATVPTPDGERILEARYRLHPEPDGEYRGSVGIVRDVTGREVRERALERQRDELATLDRIADLLLAITRDLFESATRIEIEETICDRLAASDLYRFAWIGAPGAEGRRIVPRATAGIDEGYVESATITTEDADTGRGPGGRAFRTGEVQVSHDVRTDPTFEPWRDAALERGIRSAAAVPLVHGETTYGILAVYAARPFAFTRRERAGFETLGEAAGFAIDAIAERKLLFADAIVELEFAIADPGLVFVRVSERLECELAVTGTVASTDGAWSCYLAVDGAEPTAVRDVATDDPAVGEVRILADDGASGALEFVMDDPVLDAGTGHGAVLTSGRVDDGQGRFCVEVPQDADVRRVIDRLRAAYPDSGLIAQREFDRPVRRAGELRQSIDDRLTDRQQEAITRAYHAGYFAWPRRSTAVDVAASMDIAETTFHYHLRNGLETLVAALTGLEEP